MFYFLMCLLSNFSTIIGVAISKTPTIEHLVIALIATNILWLFLGIGFIIDQLDTIIKKMK